MGFALNLESMISISGEYYAPLLNYKGEHDVYNNYEIYHNMKNSNLVMIDKRDLNKPIIKHFTDDDLDYITKIYHEIPFRELAYFHITLILKKVLNQKKLNENAPTGTFKP